MDSLAPRPALLALAALAATGCRVQPLGLQCGATNARYTLVLPDGVTERSAELGCRAGVQAATPRQSQRRLLLRLDAGALADGAAADTGGADTGAADTAAAPAAGWDDSHGVVLGLAWSGWDKRLNHTLDIEPWSWPLPGDEAALLGVAESFALRDERPDASVVTAFFTPDGATEPREFRSEFTGGWVQATRYAYQKKAGETAFLQIVIDDLELEDGAVLTLEADVALTGEELAEPGGG